jgi:zinc/manganese transport system substrate-binding protein
MNSHSSGGRRLLLKTGITALFLFLFQVGFASAAPLKIVTSVPDLADFARRVGGNSVEVLSLASGKENPHAVPLRPSYIAKIRSADLFIQMGLDMEHAYAPALLAEARNLRLQPGKEGFLDLGEDVQAIGVPVVFDRADGDVHSKGNPHYNLDPVQAQRMVRAIGDRLAALRPAEAVQFRTNAAAYGKEIEERLGSWKARLSGKSVRFISYHPDFAYFAQRFGVRQEGTIEPKPGIEPGPAHIEALVKDMKSKKVGLIVKESFYSDRVPQELARRTGATVVSVPIFVGATPEARDYLSMMDALVSGFATQ